MYLSDIIAGSSAADRHDPVLAGGSSAVELFEPIKEPLTLPL
jgi:hypothetical protein